MRKFEKQKINLDLSSNLPLSPETIAEYYLSVDVLRTIALLLGWDYDSDNQVRLKALSDGSLVVSSSGVALIHNDYFEGDADATGVELIFSDVVSKVDIWISNYDAGIKRSYDGITYDDEFLILNGEKYSFECKTKKLMIKSESATLPTHYRVIAWR